MATETLADVALTHEWADLVETHAGLAAAAAEIQNVGNGAIAIVSGGAVEPAGKSGTVLGPRERTDVNAANVWARSLDGSGTASVTLTEAA